MVCTMSFPKTALVFKYYSFKILRHLFVSTSLKEFEYVGQHADRSIIIFLWSIAFLWTGVTLDSFMIQGKLLTSKAFIKLLVYNFCENIRVCALIIFVERSNFWQALELSRFKISCFISDFVIYWNQNYLSMC